MTGGREEVPEWLRPLAKAVADGGDASTDNTVAGPRRAQGAAGEPRRSAVLVLFSAGAAVDADDPDAPVDPDLLFIERAKTLRNHPGQPAFPGGKVDPGESAVQTALREAWEETNLDPDGVVVFGVLPELYLPPTDFLVTPVLGWWRTPSPVRVRDPRETASVRRIPVSELTDPANRFRVLHPSGFSGPAFAAGSLLIWGFTASLLDGVLRIGGWEREWDATRMEPLPDEVIRLARQGRMAPAGGVPAMQPADGPATGQDK